MIKKIKEYFRNFDEPKCEDELYNEKHAKGWKWFIPIGIPIMLIMLLIFVPYNWIKDKLKK